MLNLARRHLNQEQRRTLIEDELVENPEQSDREIASALGVSNSTVSEARKELGVRIAQPVTVTGKDGKFYPRKKASRIEATGAVDQQAITAGAKKIKRDRREDRETKRRTKREAEAVARHAGLCAAGERH
jgi:hypothetical protein